MKIAINPGHCPGLDPGACSPSGLQEADVAQSIAEHIVSILKEEGNNALCVQKDSLFDICQTSNDFPAELFVSIHCNAAENTEARGTETFAHPHSDNGQKLAGYIQAQIVDAIGTVDRGVKTENFYVLKNTNCVACLVECAFISNEQDECILNTESGRYGIATAVCRGINEYIGGM